METSGSSALAMIEQPRAITLIPNEQTTNSAFALAKLAAMSGLCKTKKAEDAFFVIMHGYEIGIPAMTALRTIHIINGVPVTSGEALLAIIRRSGKVDIKITGSATEATVYMKRRDSGEEYTAHWTIARATTAGLTGKQTWKNFPQAFLQWRGVGECSKFLCSDITNGLYAAEEIAPDLNYDESGELVAGQQITITVVKKWHEEDRALTDLAERAFVKGWIEKRGEPGVKELETMIAPKTWDDFADRNAAGLHIKDTAEALLKSAPPADIDTPKPASPFDTSKPQVNPFTGEVEQVNDEPPPLTDDEIQAKALELVAEMAMVAAPARKLDLNAYPD